MTMKAIDPIEATYRHYEYNYADGTATPVFTTVQVVGESVKSLYIKASTFIRGHRPGEIIRVARKSIQFNRNHTVQDCTRKWWNE